MTLLPDRGEPRRVVVTGTGVLCSLGRGTDEVYSRLTRGDSGIKRLERLALRNNQDWAAAPLGRDEHAELADFFSGWKHLPRRLTDRMLLMATEDALSQAGLCPLPKDLGGRTAIVTVCGSGEVVSFETKLEETILSSSKERGADGIRRAAESSFVSAADWL